MSETLSRRRLIIGVLFVLAQAVLLAIIFYYGKNAHRDDSEYVFTEESFFYAADDVPEDEEHLGSNAQIVGWTDTGTGRRIVCPTISVSRGVWQVDVDYSTTTPIKSTTGVHIAAYQEEGPLYSAIDSETAKLFGDAGHRSFLFYAHSDIQVIIRAIMDDACTDDTTIHSIRVSRLAGRSLYPLLLLVAGILLMFDIVLADIFVFRKRLLLKLQSNRQTVFSLVLLVFLSSLPVFAGHLLTGYDQRFHYYRVFALSEGLRSRVFPVMIYPEYANGYGYPNGVFYPDLLLYFPAVLYLIGFRLETAYLIFQFMINAVTVAISYFAFSRLGEKGNKYGLIGSALYVMALPRLVALYTRGAMGAVCAYIFLPLLMLGLYLLFDDTVRAKKAYYYIALGASGIIASHVLGAAMAFGFSVFYLLLHIRETLTKKVLFQILRSVLIILPLSAWFLVPFLSSYIGGGLGVDQTLRDIANFTAYPAQLFSNQYNVIGDVNADIEGMHRDMPMSLGLIGLVITLLIVIGICLLEKSQKRERIESKKLLILYAVGLWMSSSWFSYRWLYANVENIYALFARFQFAYRFLAPAVGVLPICAVLVYSGLDRSTNLRGMVHMICGVAVILFVVQGTDYLMKYADEMPVFEYRDSFRELDFSALYGAEYYPADFDQNDTSATLLAGGLFEKSGSAEITYREGTKITVQVMNPSAEMIPIEIPLAFFRGYTAVSDQGEIPLEEGENHRIRLQIPPGYSGTIEVQFVLPVLWKLSMIISILTIIAMVWINRRHRP